MTCMKQEFCIHEKYCQRHIGQSFDSCILFSRNSKPMTNEEWFCTLSTEEKAEWIVHLADQCTIRHECNRCESWCDEKRVVEWLKQPHSEVADDKTM